MIYKKATDGSGPGTYAQVLADAQSRGDEILDVVTGEEPHILTKSADGRRYRFYFEETPAKEEPTMKLMKSARVAAHVRNSNALFDKAAEQVKAAKVIKSIGGTAMPKAAPIAKQDDDTEIDQETFARLSKAVRMTTYCSPASADTAVRMALESTGGDFLAKADAIRKRDGCSRQEALRQARYEYPEEFQSGQAGGLAKLLRPAAIQSLMREERLAKSGGGDFLAKVADIRKRDGGSRVRAMQTAQREHPEAFAAYQQG
jgi:hypothetical protein